MTPDSCMTRRLLVEVLVEFSSGLFQAVPCPIQIGVGFQSENDEVARLQWLDHDMLILIADVDSGWCLTQELVNRLQVVQHDALVRQMKSMGVSIQGTFEVDGLAFVIRESSRNGSIYKVQ